MFLAALQVRRQKTLRIHPAAKDTIARLAPLASDASADPDAVRLAADLPRLCPEAVRDSRRSASADAPEPPLLAAPSMVACRCRAQDVTQGSPPPAVAQEHQLEQKLLEPKIQLQAVQPVPQDESQSPQVRSREVRSGQVSPQEP